MANPLASWAHPDTLGSCTSSSSDVLWHAPLPLSIVINITGFTTTPAAPGTMDVLSVNWVAYRFSWQCWHQKNKKLVYPLHHSLSICLNSFSHKIDHWYGRWGWSWTRVRNKQGLGAIKKNLNFGALVFHFCISTFILVYWHEMMTYVELNIYSETLRVLRGVHGGIT